jgi:hypothetical protein
MAPVADTDRVRIPAGGRHFGSDPLLRNPQL